MITIFTNPRPFAGKFEAIQKNALKSWLKLFPACQIILFEDEKKTSCKAAGELGLECVADVKTNEFSTPLLSDVFLKVKSLARHDVMAQVNADIILNQSFVEAVLKVKDIMKGKPFFMTGRRYNFDVEGEVEASKDLFERAKKEGKLHRMSGMDYWVFPKSFPIEPPAFAVGRPAMDSWLIFESRRRKIPVIDATQVVDIIHQNHGYPAKKNPYFETEKKRNLELAGGLTRVATLRDADWLLTDQGLKRPGILRRIYSSLTLFYPFRLMLALKRRFL
jgi:hypothetical protein